MSSSVREAFARMEGEARAGLEREFGARDIRFERQAEMRYVGQRHNIKAPMTGAADLASVRSAFERDYRRRYGHADAKNPAEFQALHLSAFARRDRPDLAGLLEIGGVELSAQSRNVYFGAGHGWRHARILDRASLAPGAKGDGPAIIEEYGSTTLIAPDDRFEIGPLREIRIHCPKA